MEFVKCLEGEEKKRKKGMEEERRMEGIYEKDFDRKMKGKRGKGVIVGLEKLRIGDDKVLEMEI